MQIDPFIKKIYNLKEEISTKEFSYVSVYNFYYQKVNTIPNYGDFLSHTVSILRKTFYTSLFFRYRDTFSSLEREYALKQTILERELLVKDVLLYPIRAKSLPIEWTEEHVDHILDTYRCMALLATKYHLCDDICKEVFSFLIIH